MRLFVMLFAGLNAIDWAVTCGDIFDQRSSVRRWTA
jgi:hypothetical protein